MNIFIYGNDQTFRINEAFSLRFDGVTLSTHRNGEFVSSIPAQKGDSFYVIAQGMIKQPQITKAELPESYGERIAWALSFIGENKIAKSEEDFYKKLIVLCIDKPFEGCYHKSVDSLYDFVSIISFLYGFVPIFSKFIDKIKIW